MDVIALHAARQGQAAAIVDGERVVSWGELPALRNRLAAPLAALGLVTGEHVVLYAANSFEYLLASAACRAVGAIPVPMNHRLTAEEAGYILDDSDAVAIFASDTFVPMVERVRAEASKVRHVVLLGRERRSWALHVDDLLSAGDAAARSPDPGQGLGGSMIYTAGTTGRPKGALRTSHGQRLEIDGLWALQFGNGVREQPTNVLFFTAGPNDENNGLFGRIEAVPDDKND